VIVIWLNIIGLLFFVMHKAGAKIQNKAEIKSFNEKIIAMGIG